MAKFLFMSDAHIGAPEFDLTEGLIAILENGYQHVYFLGDMFDTWEMNLDKILIKYKDIVDTINKKSYKITFITGNHDPVIKDLQKIFPSMGIFDGPYKTRLNGYDVILIHGDKNDYILTMYQLMIMAPLNWAYDIGKFFKRDWKSAVRKWYYTKKYERFAYNVMTSLEKNTLDEFKKDCDILIMGHTHTPKIISIPDCRYVNCGSLLFRPTYVEYDDETNKFSLVKL